MESNNLLKNWILPLGIVSVGVLIFIVLLALKPKAGFTPPHERVVPVETATLEATTETVELRVSGTVEAARRISLMPEVGGRIAKLADAFRPGGAFKAGEPMLWIDPADLQTALAQAESALAQAEYNHRQELGRQKVAQHEWSMIENQETATELEKDLTLRKPQLIQAKAALDAAKAAVEKARLDVRRACIVAPFNAQIISRSVELGSQVSTQTTLAEIAGTDEYWVSATIAAGDLQWLEIPGTRARITLGGAKAAEGEVFALEPALESNGRLARILIRIPDPLAAKPALLIGSYVQAELAGKTVPGIFALPADAVHRGRVVWLMNADERLEEREIDILWETRDRVFARGGPRPGDRLVLTDIPSPMPGLKLASQPTEETSE